MNARNDVERSSDLSVDSRFVRACVPDPRIARSPASSRASACVAAALAAAVLIAVTSVASIARSKKVYAAVALRRCNTKASTTWPC